jgi:hypothetical protein
MSFTNTHHSFSTELATKYGIPQAIIIHHFQHWIKINKRLKKNFKEEKTWTYQSKKEIAAHFPYFSEDQIRRYIDDLVEKEVLIKGNFNKSPFDQTKWYAFKCEKTFIGKDPKYSNKDPCMANPPNAQSNPPNGEGECAQYIKDINPKDISLNKKGDSANASRLYGKFVRLRDDEYDSLKEQYGSTILDMMIQNINNHLASTGKKPYKDYAATIRNWIAKKNPDAPVYSRQERANRDFIQEAMRKYPDSFKFCVIRGIYVINKTTKEEILIDIEHETFKLALIKLFGKRKKDVS